MHQKSLIGIVTGAANGLFGAGGGTILVPALEKFLKIEAHKAHATALAAIFPLSPSIKLLLRPPLAGWLPIFTGEPPPILKWKRATFAPSKVPALCVKTVPFGRFVKSLICVLSGIVITVVKIISSAVRVIVCGDAKEVPAGALSIANTSAE